MILTSVSTTQNNFLMKENSSQYTNHDLLFKQLINEFFEEFLEAFFPEFHAQIDFQHITPIPEEIFTDLIDGEVRRLDIAVEVKWKETDTLIIVHIEPQSYEQKTFNNRMFKYFSLLYHKFHKPIIPIAVFSYDENWEEDVFNMQFLHLKVLHFQYLKIHLRKQNWRKFMKKDNPISAALLSKMGFSHKERVQVKLEFMKILARLQVNKAQHRLLYGFFESYLKLTKEEEEIFVKEARKLDDAEKILEIPISYEEEGKRLGRVEGREEGKRLGRVEGRVHGKKEVALEMLKDGFPIDKISKLTRLATDEIEQLKQLI